MKNVFTWFENLTIENNDVQLKDQNRSVRSAIKKSTNLTVGVTLILLISLHIFFKENKVFAILSILTVIIAFFISEAFQQAKGLVADGEVGKITAKELGIVL